MLGPSKGVAHVSYNGGGLCLPARSPYDRQLLMEEVLRQSHIHGIVQILLDNDRWLVHGLRGHSRVSCARCGRLTGSACHSGSRGEAVFCVGCVVDDELPPTNGHRSMLRAAS